MIPNGAPAQSTRAALCSDALGLVSPSFGAEHRMHIPAPRVLQRSDEVRQEEIAWFALSVP